jgi:hypothetical protein
LACFHEIYRNHALYDCSQLVHSCACSWPTPHRSSSSAWTRCHTHTTSAQPKLANAQCSKLPPKCFKYKVRQKAFHESRNHPQHNHNSRLPATLQSIHNSTRCLSHQSRPLSPPALHTSAILLLVAHACAGMTTSPHLKTVLPPHKSLILSAHPMPTSSGKANE